LSTQFLHDIEKIVLKFFFGIGFVYKFGMDDISISAFYIPTFVFLCSKQALVTEPETKAWAIQFAVTKFLGTSSQVP
jgi:hypothetical protein